MFVRPWKSLRTGYSYYCKHISSQSKLSSSDAIDLSDTCVQKLKQLCKGNAFLRLCVESGGCSGFQYKFDLDDKIADDDKFIPRNYKPRLFRRLLTPAIEHFIFIN